VSPSATAGRKRAESHRLGRVHSFTRCQILVCLSIGLNLCLAYVNWRMDNLRYILPPLSTLTAVYAAYRLVVVTRRHRRTLAQMEEWERDFKARFGQACSRYDHHQVSDKGAKFIRAKKKGRCSAVPE
jgi:hypothetical protein